MGPFSAVYQYDAHGNMTQMPHLAQMQWTYNDQLSCVDLGGGGTAYYVYDASGQRVRKVIERQGALTEERIYLGGYEIFRRRTGATLTLERQTLHVMDDKRPIAMVETKTHDSSAPVASPTPLTRYQLDNHLDSACLELDQTGAVISYEEYYPYGSTSYAATRSGVALHYGFFHLAYQVFLVQEGNASFKDIGGRDLLLILGLAVAFWYAHATSHRDHVAADLRRWPTSAR